MSAVRLPETLFRAVGPNNFITAPFEQHGDQLYGHLFVVNNEYFLGHPQLIP